LGQAHCHLECGVIGLDNLLDGGKVLPDEEVEVRWNLETSDVRLHCFAPVNIIPKVRIFRNNYFQRYLSSRRAVPPASPTRL
jgi:hypothetical protein